MKTLNETFTDEEFKKLCKAKAHHSCPVSWHDFIMFKCSKGISVKKKMKGGNEDGRNK